MMMKTDKKMLAKQKKIRNQYDFFFGTFSPYSTISVKPDF